MVDPEQKSVGLMENLVIGSWKSDKLVVDLLFGTFASVRACLELPRYHRFVGCDVDADCTEASKEVLIYTYGRLLLDKKWNTSSTAAVVDACKMVDRALDVLLARKGMSLMEAACRASCGADISIAHHKLSLEFVLGSVFVRERQRVSIGSVAVYVEDDVLSAECGGVVCYKALFHWGSAEEVSFFPGESGRGLSTARPVGRERVVGYYYGPPVYEHLSSTGSRYKIYDESITKVK